MIDQLAIGALPSISLDELNQSAPLLTRKDRKYVVPVSVARLLSEQSGWRVLEIGGLRTFRYESVYFDTPDRVSYRAAAHKRRRRFKVRTRTYLDSDLCLLEVKTREGRGLTEKHQMPYDIQFRHSLNDEALDFVDQFGQIAPLSRQLQPVLTTRYERTTLLDEESGSRVTIDTNLECEAVDGSRILVGDEAVVETKTSGRPCAADHFLWSVHQRPTKISKYGTGLAALTPGLPANKWNRVLRSSFGWTPAPAASAAELRPPVPVAPSGAKILQAVGW